MQKEYIMTKREMEAYCGDTKQIFGIQECRLEGGKATGTKAFHVRNGKGIETLILADKCLGIGQLFFKGTNIGFLSKAGIVAPQFFSEEGTRGFLRTFEAGFLTTCGLSYMGQPSEVNGQKNGLHGVISNIPVESLSSDVVWSENGDAVMLLTGKASEGYLFGPNLEIRKTILIHTEQNRLEIHDRVDNKGFSESPLMLLYHMNFGYPMLDENVQIYNNYDSAAVSPRPTGTVISLLASGMGVSSVFFYIAFHIATGREILSSFWNGCLRHRSDRSHSAPQSLKRCVPGNVHAAAARSDSWK